MTNDQSAGKSGNQGSLSTLRKELVVPILVSVISGIALATYQNYLSKDNAQSTKIDTTQQIKSADPIPATDPKAAAAMQRAQEIEQIKQTLDDYETQAKQLLDENNCEEAKEVIRKVVWTKPDLDKSKSLQLHYDGVRHKLTDQLTFCSIKEPLELAQKDAESAVVRTANAAISDRYRSIDMMVIDHDIIKKSEEYNNDMFTTSYLYQMKGEGTGGQVKNFQVSIKCNIPVYDGKPGSPKIGTPTITEIPEN